MVAKFLSISAALGLDNPSAVRSVISTAWRHKGASREASVRVSVVESQCSNFGDNSVRGISEHLVPLFKAADSRIEFLDVIVPFKIIKVEYIKLKFTFF